MMRKKIAKQREMQAEVDAAAAAAAAEVAKAALAPEVVES
jgi:hypothetical protein